MKLLLSICLALVSVQFSFSQTNNPQAHPWILCDGNGQPVKSSGQNFYMIFELGRINMYCGKDFSTAKENGVQKYGTFSKDTNYIWWTWSNGEKSGDWVYSNNMMTSPDGKAMLRDVSLFR
ncbi:MAG: hypothetical protein ACK44B_07460 [Flavobacteriales bacterium]|jgi:hypothetical protein